MGNGEGEREEVDGKRLRLDRAFLEGKVEGCEDSDKLETCKKWCNSRDEGTNKLRRLSERLCNVDSRLFRLGLEDRKRLLG